MRHYPFLVCQLFEATTLLKTSYISAEKEIGEKLNSERARSRRKHVNVKGYVR